MTKNCGEDAPETADLSFAYGKALLKNAISQSSVLGKDQPEENKEDEVDVGEWPDPVVLWRRGGHREPRGGSVRRRAEYRRRGRGCRGRGR
ncbi:hypothetical protein C8R44DRAFT_790840 [Mycena epipterygia]|nr:hypothetical protein C8R44DRAFT_790840 [Mycena epipterygia]